VYHGADGWNVLRFTESWRARAAPSARPMRVARRSPDSAFPSGRGYHLTRRWFRRTDGRQRSNGEAPRPSATAKVAPVQDPSPPSWPTCGPPRRLLFLAPQEQVDALSDEGRGGPVFRVRDELPSPMRMPTGIKAPKPPWTRAPSLTHSSGVSARPVTMPQPTSKRERSPIRKCKFIAVRSWCNNCD
jgi:hypothetical protein